jgi:hypothetical protein
MDKQMLLKFADAIQRKKLMSITFVTKSGEQLNRRCVPLDLAPSERAKIKHYKYHVWDLDSLPKPHLLSLNPEQIVSMDIIPEEFLPEQIVTWVRKKPWVIERDWGGSS